MSDTPVSTGSHDYYLVSTEFPFGVIETLKRLSTQFDIEVVSIEGMALPTINEEDLAQLASCQDPSVLYLVRRAQTVQEALERLEALFVAMEREEGLSSPDR
jgi:hypothetical protein